MNPEARFPCPCCGYRTYAQEAGGTMQICPVCGWEDAPGDRPTNGSNSVALPTAQRNYERIGACELEFLDLVRPPDSREFRDQPWITFGDTCQAIIRFIGEVFERVTLGAGTPLRECIDNLTSTRDIDRLLTIKPAKRWQDITRHDLEIHGMCLRLLDPKGIRFHLPAFMNASLELWHESPFDDFMASDLLILGLAKGPHSGRPHEEDFGLFDLSQRQAVAAYLKFVAISGDIFHEDAREGLDRGWQEWLPDFIPFPSTSDPFHHFP